MKSISMAFASLTLLAVLVTSCVFYPVQTQEQVDARHTVQAEVVLPTVTPAPAEATATAEVEATAVVVATVEATQVACEIKGNIGSDGSLIYHMPDGAYYSRVHIDLDRHNAAGVHEQYFCDEASAQAAGFRKSAR